MAAPALSDELAQQAADAFEQHGSKAEAARVLGLPIQTFKSRLAVAAERGMLGTKPVLPGFRLTKTTAVTNQDGDVVREFIQQKLEPGPEFAVPAGHRIKGISAYTDAAGRVISQWVKTKEGQLDPLEVAEALKAAFVGYEPAAAPAPAPAHPSTKLITVLPCNDWHIGMFAWGKQTDTNWDLKIAEQTIGRAAEDTVRRAPASAVCVVLGGGDLLHADNHDNKTERSGPTRDGDGHPQ